MSTERRRSVSATTRLLADKDEIRDVIYRLFIHTDRRGWQTVEECFTPRVIFDMSSAGGGPPTEMAASEITRGWDSGLRAIAHVHHQAGNMLVDVHGDEATAFCYAIALHHTPQAPGGDTRTFVGSYDFGLERLDGRWRIKLFRFDLKYITGNLELGA